MYIDVHCHLDMLTGIRDVVERARKKGVGKILANGVRPSINRDVLMFSGEFKEVEACLGIYPIDALSMKDKEIDKEIDLIRNNANKVLGIGEVGMDFKEDSENHKRQRKIFEKFVKLSIELDKPITVHSRKAEKECIEVLEKLKAKKVIMHYFSGKLNFVPKILHNGWYLSIPTAVKNSEHFQNIVKLTPISYLLCETDSPYSHPDKKYPNEPANVISSYEVIAKIKKRPLETIERKIEENFKMLFGLS